MFVESQITECVSKQANFTNSINPDYPVLPAGLTTSETGRAVNFVHPLATIENLFNTAPEMTSGAFVNYLTTLKSQTAIELVTKVIEQRKLSQTSKSTIENLRIYEGGGLLNNRIINLSKFVGFEITLHSNINLVSVISQVGLQLSSAVTDLPIYLFYANSSTPVATALLSSAGGLSYTWVDVDGFEMRDSRGEKFYLGYFQDDLGAAQAINKEIDFSRFCYSCNRYNWRAHEQWSKKISIRPISVDEEYLNGSNMFDVSGVTQSNSNYGLNFALSIKCDVSQYICTNRFSFSDAYAKLLALKCLEVMATTVRIGTLITYVKEQAAAELDPDPKSGSLKAEFEKSLKAVSLDIVGFDGDCLPCYSRQGIKWGVV